MSDEQQQPPQTPESAQPFAESQQQWIAVPPPHPYAEAPKQTGGKGLAITAMALGLLALFSVLVAAFYFSVFVVLAGFIGLVAVVLGIMALVKRSQPKAASLTGLIAGVLTLITALLVGAFGLVALTTGVLGTTPGATEEGGEQWTPETPAEALIEWPSNMATGGIIFTGPGNPQPLTAAPLEPGTVPQPNQVDRASGANDVLVYVDYRCPHCMAFEQANSELLEQAIADGTSVEIVPVSFLDRASESAYYSSRAAGAMSCLADSQPEGAWAAHLALLSPDVQPGAGPGLSNDELIAVIDDAVGGVNPAASDCIESERFVGFAQALNSWVFANTVPNAIDPELRVQGTPLALVNGVPYLGDPSDAVAFATFYAEHTN